MSNDLLIDKRIIERNIKRGRLDAAQHRSMLDALPDLRGKGFTGEADALAGCADSLSDGAHGRKL